MIKTSAPTLAAAPPLAWVVSASPAGATSRAANRKTHAIKGVKKVVDLLG